MAIDFDGEIFYNNLYNDAGSSVISVRVSVLDKNTDNVERLKVMK